MATRKQNRRRIFRFTTATANTRASRPKARLNVENLESRVTPVRIGSGYWDMIRSGGPAVVVTPPTSAPASTAAWTRLDSVPAAPEGKVSYLGLNQFIPLSLNSAAINAVLDLAPPEAQVAAPDSSVILSLPNPSGGMDRFRIVTVPMLAPELAAQFPGIRTFRGQGIDDPAATLAADFTYQGFHAQVLSPNGSWYIDPYYHLDTSVYASYYRSDMAPREPQPCLLCQGAGCGVCQDAEIAALMAPAVPDKTEPDPEFGLMRSGTQLRTYRAAVAATGEYTIFHGGTVAAGLSAITTAMNRVSGVYEVELSIRMTLIANNNVIVYTNPNTDPYTNSNGSTMLGQNQSNLDSVIGNANYDIGHVFSTGGGGIAGLGVVGITGQKARGVTGSPQPIGDPFTIDYVAHEMGHQFRGNHSFNTSSAGGNRNASTAYEPGSGSTIMGYAGITGANSDLQPNSDAYFHSISFDEIINFVDNTIPGVGTRTATGNSVPTVIAVTAGPYTIPANTPFFLTAQGSDANGDTLTYCWEQRNLGPANLLNSPDNGQSPLFRSLLPTTNPTRYFPRLSSILNNSNPTGNAEKLPTVNWPGGGGSVPMRFRVTVRDNRAGGGGVNTAGGNSTSDVNSIAVSVVNTGSAFAITSQNSFVSYAAGSTQTVTWNVAGTTANGINAANVDILLSTDGGLNFNTVLVSNTPNDGSESFVIPNLPTTQARIKVQPVGNIFFDINNANFTITSAPPQVQSVVVNDGSAQRSMVTSLTVTFNTTVSFAGAPAAAFTLTRVNGGSVGSFTATPTVVGGQTVVTIGNFSGAETQFGSLADGRYVLTIIPNQVFTAGGQLAGQNVFDDSNGLFRFFGDINGSRTVDIQDFGQFSSTYNLQLGQTGYIAAFDFNGDNRIDIADFGQFSVRYFTTLP